MKRNGTPSRTAGRPAEAGATDRGNGLSPGRSPHALPPQIVAGLTDRTNHMIRHKAVARTMRSASGHPVGLSAATYVNWQVS